SLSDLVSLPLPSSLFCSCFLLFVFLLFFSPSRPPRPLHSFPTRRSSDLVPCVLLLPAAHRPGAANPVFVPDCRTTEYTEYRSDRSEEHTSELQSRFDLVCRLLLEKKKKKIQQAKGHRRGMKQGSLAATRP